MTSTDNSAEKMTTEASEAGVCDDCELEKLLSSLTDEEVFLEYKLWLTTIPSSLLSHKKSGIIEIVKQELQIEERMKRNISLASINIDGFFDRQQEKYEKISDNKDLVKTVVRDLLAEQRIKNILMFNSVSSGCDTFHHTRRGELLIDLLGIKLGWSLKIMCPPVSTCEFCHKNLQMQHDATQVVLHTNNGPVLYSKFTYRCSSCRVLGKKNVNYHRNRYGNETLGYIFYPNYNISHIMASNEVWLDETLIREYTLNLCHGFMSMESQAEAYNQLHQNSDQVHIMKKFLAKNTSVGGHFNRADKKTDDIIDPDDENSEKSKEKEAISGMHELNRKSISLALNTLWVNEELRERKETHKVLFGPKQTADGKMSYKETIEAYLVSVDARRTEEIYEHKECHSGCSRRGCGNVWVMDGIWKLHYPLW